MDRQRMLNAIRALRALTDEEYELVREAVSRTPTREAAPTQAKVLTGRAPKGSSLASERAKKAWRTRKRNEKKRQNQEAGSGTSGDGSQDAPASDRVA